VRLVLLEDLPPPRARGSVDLPHWSSEDGLAILAGLEKCYGTELDFRDSLEFGAVGSVGALQLGFPRL
jgi:hypothetical protein